MKKLILIDKKLINISPIKKQNAFSLSSQRNWIFNNKQKNKINQKIEMKNILFLILIDQCIMTS